MIDLAKSGTNVIVKDKKNPENAAQDEFNQHQEKLGQTHQKVQNQDKEKESLIEQEEKHEEITKQDEADHHSWLETFGTWQEKIQKSWPLRWVFENRKAIIQTGLGVLSKETKQRWGNHLKGLQWVHEQMKRHKFHIIHPEQQKKLNLSQLGNKQIQFIEPSPSQLKLAELKKQGKVFLDQVFPPNDRSLNGEYVIGAQEKPTWSKIAWRKISDVMVNPALFSGRIEPNDIEQGFLGDCYFLAGLAALAERPDRIFDLFLTQQMNDQKYYSVKMLYKGKWMTIDMDEYVPWLYGQPAFTHAKQAELWVVLLEKAWAKLYTSYKRIEAGYPEEALHDLTGAPCRLIQLKAFHFNKEREWQYLVEASKKQYAMVASSNPGSDVNKSVSGVVQGHAYTVLNATTLHFKGREQRVVQVRNPWGSDEFTGRWSDFDKNWELISAEQKERIGFRPTKKDGIFFMTYDDFCIEFRAVTVAEIDDNASYVYKSYQDKECRGVFFGIDIVREDDYSFQVDKTPQRIYPDKYQSSFNYPEALIEVGKIQGNTCTKSQVVRSLERTTVKKERLTPGRYVVFVRIGYNPDYENQFDVNLSVYSKTACNIELATRQEAIVYTGLKNVAWTGKQKVSNIPWNTMGNIDSEGNNNFVPAISTQKKQEAIEEEPKKVE